MADALSTREVADRLGVKPETVYAYVSRGLLTSDRGRGGRGSRFEAKEVDALARRTRRHGSLAQDGPIGGGIKTGITLIEADRHYYRGVDALELAGRHSYEEVAVWLWTGVLTPGVQFTAPPDALSAARRAVAALEHAGPLDRLRVATVAASAADPVRFDLSEDVVTTSAPGLIATLVASLPSRTDLPADRPIAEQLWSRLVVDPPDTAWLSCLNTALVLLIDHDLAASTLAVRVAASAHANPYAVVSAGLGALEGSLHGGASSLAHKMLVDALERDAAGPVVASLLREGRRIPGLGHRIYPHEDPRAVLLLEKLRTIPAVEPVAAMAQSVADAATRHGRVLFPNIDLVLAVMSVAAGMDSEASETIFAVARVAGWIAHALEEYHERPARMRPLGRYTGPKPPQPLP